VKIPFWPHANNRESETPMSEYDPHGKGFDGQSTAEVPAVDRGNYQPGVTEHRAAPGEPGGPADLPDAAVPQEWSHADPPESDHPRYGKSFNREELIDDIADPRPISPATSGSRIMFDDIPAPEPGRVKCSACRGTGYRMTTSDFLRESIGLIEGQEDNVVREFYRRLLDVAPHLASLFPSDLVDEDPLAGDGSMDLDEDGRRALAEAAGFQWSPELDREIMARHARRGAGRKQRDKLVGALAALATHYDPTNPAQMETLKTALAAMGRAHSAFRRPDGTVSPASLDEYQAVKVVLFGTLHDAAGAAWLSVYDGAWSEAYDFAASHMMVAAFANPQSFARTVRASR
jgi:hemoglobin-like flavoprotein